MADIVGSFQRGQQFGTQQRQQRETEQRRGRLSELAQLAYGAQPMQRQELVRQAIGVDPGAGFELDQSLQKAGEAKMQELVNSARLFISAPEAARPNLMQSLRPRFEELGLDVPDYTPENAAQFLENAKAFVASHGGAGGDVPTGFRQLDLSAQAAGFEPGTPEYQNFFRVAGGIQGRAPSGGFGLEFIPGVGFIRKNPRGGVIEVYDPQGGDFARIGTGAELNAGGPAGAVTDVGQITPDVGQPAPVGSITLEGASPQQNQQIEAVSRFMAAQGIPQPQIDEWVASQAAAMGGQPSAPAQVAQPSAPSPAAQRFGDITTRTPEQQAFLTEQEKERARQEAFGRSTGLEAEREAAKTTARETAEAQAQRAQALPQVIATADQTIGVIDSLINHPGRVAATGLSSLADPRNRIPGTDAYNFRVALDRLKGQAFIQAFQSLRGGGAITEREGKAATDSIAALDSAQSEGEFLKALRDLRSVVDSGKKRAMQSAGGNRAAPSGQQPTRRLRWNPQTQRLE